MITPKKKIKKLAELFIDEEELEAELNKLNIIDETVGDKIKQEIMKEIEERVEKCVNENELKRVKMEVVNKIREQLKKYINEEQLEAELNKLKKKWSLDDEDKITEKIMKDIEVF